MNEDNARLPDPLLASDGTKITSARAWSEKRRPELLELFRTHVYGRAPIGRPKDLAFAVAHETPGVMDGKATRKQISITFSGPGAKGKIGLLLFVPTAVRRAPTFLTICHRAPTNIDPTRATRTEFWPAEAIVSRGYAAAAFDVADVDPDHDDGFKNGVHGIFDRQRTPESWGTIAAWAWGASRALDYLVTDPDVDGGKVAIVGHSRGGKTALWAGAEDVRFALAVSNESGCTGAAISRGKQGESVERINQSFPYWFCENYRKFSGRENELPIDQHELLALIAPRPVYVASAVEDTWSDPASEFRSCVAAGPVYRMLGKKGVESERMPRPESPLLGGTIGYHLRSGKHDLNRYDWDRFLDFADRRLR